MPGTQPVHVAQGAQGVQTVHGTTLVERAVESPLAAIGGGLFEPGAKLPNEVELAAQLGVSRTATREALQRLVSLDVISARHGHGYFVEQVAAAQAIRPEVLALSRGPEELLEILEARVALEKELAILAARRASVADVERLRAALQELRAAVAAKTPGTEADVTFHLAIAGAAGNAFLYRLTDVIRVYLERMRRSLPSWSHDRTDMLACHAAIVEAIAAHDEVGAVTAMQSHMDMVLHQFESRRDRVADL